LLPNFPVAQLSLAAFFRCLFSVIFYRCCFCGESRVPEAVMRATSVDDVTGRQQQQQQQQAAAPVMKTIAARRH